MWKSGMLLSTLQYTKWPPPMENRASITLPGTIQYLDESQRINNKGGVSKLFFIGISKCRRAVRKGDKKRRVPEQHRAGDF